MPSASRASPAGDQPPVGALWSIYRHKILPVETAYRFDAFYTPLLSEAELAAKPTILLLGQYSTGKTTFIQHIIGREYCGSRIGPEPTTDRFVAVMGGATTPRIIPGNAAAVQTNMPFEGLSRFGTAFLSKFAVSENPGCALLDSVTLIDSPGVLSGGKQRLDRGYDFERVTQWFAEHADLILLFFDAHKLDISDELRAVIDVLRPFDDKVRLILNKADEVSKQELMRCYGALMWSIGKIVQTPEVMRVYIGSFRADCGQKDALLDSEEADLLGEIQRLPLQSAVRKTNDIVKRARLARVHSLLINALRSQMPAVFGKAAKQTRLLAALEDECSKLQQTKNLSPGDFPKIDRLRSVLSGMDLCDFPRLSSSAQRALDEALSVDIPRFIQSLPNSEATVFGAMRDAVLAQTSNPFDISNAPVALSAGRIAQDCDHAAHSALFATLIDANAPSQFLSGKRSQSFFVQSGLPGRDLAHLWTLADRDRDGALSEREFSVMMHLVRLRLGGIPLEDIDEPAVAALFV